MLQRPQNTVVDMSMRVDETLNTVPKVNWNIERGPVSGGFGGEIVSTKRSGLISNLGPESKCVATRAERAPSNDS